LWIQENGQTASDKFNGLFMCEKGDLLWTVIDYGYCIVEGCAHIADSGHAWELMQDIVDSQSGPLTNLIMSSSLWMGMLYKAVIQLLGKSRKAKK
jgi:hypothetical protein